MTREKRVAIVAGIIVVTAVASLFSHQAVIFRIRKMRKRGFWRLFYSDPSVVQDGAGNAGRCTSHGRLIGGLCCAPTQGPTAANAWIGKALAAVAQDWPTLVPNAGLAAGIGLAAGVAPAPAAAFSVICAAAPQPVACPANITSGGYLNVTGGEVVVSSGGGTPAGTYPFQTTNDAFQPLGIGNGWAGNSSNATLNYAIIGSIIVKCTGNSWSINLTADYPLYYNYAGTNYTVYPATCNSVANYDATGKVNGTFSGNIATGSNTGPVVGTYSFTVQWSPTHN